MSVKVVMVSGGYDPVHIGHVRQFKEASCLGKVLVALCSDEWVKRKKGYVFMTYVERKEILESIRYVWKVVPQLGEGESAVDSLVRYRPDIFAKGGDRGPGNMPRGELDVCMELGIEILYGVGGAKVQSSSHLVEKAR